jgi:hypothetical protein
MALTTEGALAREAAKRALKQRTLTEIKSLARTQTKQAINTLLKIMLNEEAPAAARVSAAVAILDRGWGKPVQPVANEDGQPIDVVHRVERIIVYPDGHTDCLIEINPEIPARREPVSVLGSLGATGDLKTSPHELWQLGRTDHDRE